MEKFRYKFWTYYSDGTTLTIHIDDTALESAVDRFKLLTGQSESSIGKIRIRRLS